MQNRVFTDNLAGGCRIVADLARFGGDGNLTCTAGSASPADSAPENGSWKAGGGIPVAHEGAYVVVGARDCIESIAARAGLHWETVWNHPKNRELREARKEPNILMEGDNVFVPEKRLEMLSRETGRAHRFRRIGVPSKIRIILEWGGKPRANQPYIVNIPGRRIEGTTDDEGLIEFPIPPHAEHGELVIGDSDFNRRVIPLMLGGMDPIDEVRGIQKRLANLGFDCDPTGRRDEQTCAAVAAFQKAHDLEATGEIDDATRDAIRTEHGS